MTATTPTRPTPGTRWLSVTYCPKTGKVHVAPTAPKPKKV